MPLSDEDQQKVNAAIVGYIEQHHSHIWNLLQQSTIARVQMKRDARRDLDTISKAIETATANIVEKRDAGQSIEEDSKALVALYGRSRVLLDRALDSDKMVLPWMKRVGELIHALGADDDFSSFIAAFSRSHPTIKPDNIIMSVENALLYHHLRLEEAILAVESRPGLKAFDSWVEAVNAEAQARRESRKP